MTGFYYFLSTCAPTDITRNSRVHRPTLVARGLGEILDDCRTVPQDLIVCDVLQGPGGVAGQLLYPIPPHGRLPDRVSYAPEVQTFEQVGRIANPSHEPNPSREPNPSQQLWIGWQTDSPPLPEDLLRRDAIGGREINDAHGNGWLIPVARAHANQRGTLPFAVHWDQAGKSAVSVADRYRQIWDDSARLWDLMARAAPTGGGLPMLGEDFTAEEDAFCIDLVCRAISINYRIGGPVWYQLDRLRPGWCSQLFASLCANVMVDLHARTVWEESQKKTDALSEVGGLSSTPGLPDVIPADSPPVVASLP